MLHPSQIHRLWTFITLLITAACLGGTAMAQNVLTGKVTNAANGDPIPGVNILVVGKQAGATTNAEGHYRINLPAGSYQIRAGFVGYKVMVQPVTVKGATQLDFKLNEDLVGTGEVVVLGTRRDDRTVTDSPVPIDVITPKDLQGSGATETMQVIQALVPSYNAPQSSITDGTDHIKVATLRGLAPDQMLVLINGKRQHSSALVNVNGSVGRGSVGVDMNSIPASAIERVEVLRDGAAAQYGSDAIAGVINVILKQKTGLDLRVNAGQYVSSELRGYTEADGNRMKADGTSYDTASSFDFDGVGEKGTTYIGGSPTETVSRTDGQTATVNLGYGLALGDKGSLYISTELLTKDYASRNGLDPRRQYFGTLNGNLVMSGGTDDARETTVNRNNHRYGPGSADAATIFMNSNYQLRENANLYAFGGYSYRSGVTGCFFRRALDDRTVRSLYPDGFLPLINGIVKDGTFSVGFKGALGDWSYDVSEKVGSSSLLFHMKDVANVSYGTLNTQKTEIDSGGMTFNQASTNVDFFRQLNIGTASPLSVAVGAEFRHERYFITAGEDVSYKNGGQKILDGPNVGKNPSIGCQCFPGFNPSNASDANRNSFGLYADFENNLTSAILLSAAARFEKYSDFGSNFSWKAATKIDLVEGLALRGAVSTGFHAPSLQQSYFATVSTNFNSQGIPTDNFTAPVNSALAKALGSKDLTPEKSFNLSAGLTFSGGPIALTIDAYQIDIKDRIAFTENFNNAAVATYLASLNIPAAGARYFTNAIDTRTQGLDITGRYGTALGKGKLKVSLALNFNKTKITNTTTEDKVVNGGNPFLRIIEAPAQLKGFGYNSLISRQRLNDYEGAQPGDKQTITFQYDVNNIGVTLRGMRYGTYWERQNVNPDATTGYAYTDQKFSAKFLTDLELTYRFLAGPVLAVGANNLFDVYPDKVYKAYSNSGTLPYSSFSPFGFMGRYVYGRINVSL